MKPLLFLLAFVQLYSEKIIRTPLTSTLGSTRILFATEVATTDIISVLRSDDELLSTYDEPSEDGEYTDQHGNDVLLDSQLLWKKHKENQRATGSPPKTGQGAFTHLLVSLGLFYSSLLVILIVALSGPGSFVSPFLYTLSLISFGTSLVGLFLYGLFQA